MPAPLTNKQKRILSQDTERAYRFEAAKARGRGEEWDMSAKAINQWRHDQVVIAVQKVGLRCCSQADYSAVKAHFLHILGEDGKAMRSLVRSQSEEQRQYEWKITEACRALGVQIFYANGICRRMFHGTVLLDASVDQLRKVFIALNAELHKRRTRAQGPRAAISHPKSQVA